MRCRVVFGIVLIFGTCCLLGQSASFNPPSWNFLIKKPEPVVVQKVEVEDSLRVPPLDFLIKPTAQDKRFRDDDEEEYDDDDERMPHRRPPPQHKNKKNPANKQSWNVLKTSKRAVVNYLKAVKKMFTNANDEEDDANYHQKSRVQERGDRNPSVAIQPLDQVPKTKYGTRVELDEANRVKAVAMVVSGDEGDPMSDSYFKETKESDDGEGLGIGDAISDFFWGSVYQGTKK